MKSFLKSPLAFLKLLFLNSINPLGDRQLVFEDNAKKSWKFGPYYAEHIRPKVKEFDQKRVKALKQLRTRTWLSLLGIHVAFAGAGLALLYNSDLGNIVFFGAIFISGALFAWAYVPVQKYKSSIKNDIFPLIFKFLGNDYNFSENCPVSVRSLDPSKLIPSYDDENTEDYVHGTYKDVHVEWFEAHMTEEKGSGKNKRTETVFDGIFIRLNMNKNFNGQTVVTRDMGRFGNWAMGKPMGLENVKLEDPTFEKRFEVFSDDQVEARYLLTTAFMERLIKMADLFNSKSVQCSFYDDHLLIMIATKKNYFEPASVFEPATFFDDTNTVLSEMHLIFEIIDTLKLDQRTGL